MDFYSVGNDIENGVRINDFDWGDEKATARIEFEEDFLGLESAF
jgi:hypothetical protein